MTADESPVVDRADITGLVGGAVRGGGSPNTAPPVLGCHIEYALQCANSRILGHFRTVEIAQEVKDVRDYTSSHPHAHSVVARLVSDWSDPGSVAVWGQQK